MSNGDGEERSFQQRLSRKTGLPGVRSLSGEFKISLNWAVVSMDWMQVLISMQALCGVWRGSSVLCTGFLEHVQTYPDSFLVHAGAAGGETVLQHDAALGHGHRVPSPVQLVMRVTIFRL